MLVNPYVTSVSSLGFVPNQSKNGRVDIYFDRQVTSGVVMKIAKLLRFIGYHLTARSRYEDGGFNSVIFIYSRVSDTEILDRIQKVVKVFDDRFNDKANIMFDKFLTFFKHSPAKTFDDNLRILRNCAFSGYLTKGFKDKKFLIDNCFALSKTTLGKDMYLNIFFEWFKVDISLDKVSNRMKVRLRRINKATRKFIIRGM